MRLKITLCAMTALALLAGCNRGATANNSAANAARPANTTAPVPAPLPTNTAAPAGNTAAPAGEPVEESFLLGRWAPAGNCAMALEFKADGTIAAPPGGTWSLDGTALTMAIGTEAAETGTVTRSGDNLVMTGPSGGPSNTLVRCP